MMWLSGFCFGIVIGIIGVFFIAYASASNRKKNDDKDVDK